MWCCRCRCRCRCRRWPLRCEACTSDCVMRTAACAHANFYNAARTNKRADARTHQKTRVRETNAHTHAHVCTSAKTRARVCACVRASVRAQMNCACARNPLVACSGGGGGGGFDHCCKAVRASVCDVVGARTQTLALALPHDRAMRTQTTRTSRTAHRMQLTVALASSLAECKKQHTSRSW